MTVETIDTATFGQEWAAWHRQHEAVRAGPHGFLAITGLHWLATDPQRFPGTFLTAVGLWWPDADVATLDQPGPAYSTISTGIT